MFKIVSKIGVTIFRKFLNFLGSRIRLVGHVVEGNANNAEWEECGGEEQKHKGEVVVAGMIPREISGNFFLKNDVKTKGAKRH